MLDACLITNSSTGLNQLICIQTFESKISTISSRVALVLFWIRAFPNNSIQQDRFRMKPQRIIKE